MLRSEVQVKNVEPNLLDADIAVKQCQLQLNVLMGIDETINIVPNVTMEDMQKDMYGYLLESKSLADNSSLRSLELQQKMARQNVTLKKFAWIPTLGASFNVNWLSLSNGPAFRDVDFAPYSSLGLSLFRSYLLGRYKVESVEAGASAVQRTGITARESDQ